MSINNFRPNGSYDRKINRIYNESERMKLNVTSKIVIMSDCHRGTGRWNDNFAGNEQITFAALGYYYRKGFTYIELGDGDELWENKNYDNIINRYGEIFWLMSKFYKEGRLKMIYGNHDIVKRNKKFTDKHLDKYYCIREKRFVSMLEDIEAKQSYVLEDTVNDRDIFLLHGHQGSFINDKCWRLGRWLVRNIWSPLELVGFNNPNTPPADNYKKARKNEKLEKWADYHRITTIAGHTHRPSYPENGSYYYNSGSLIHPRCITAIEIERGRIMLVKWCVSPDECNRLMVCREILAEN